MIYRDIVDSLPAAPGGGQMVVSTSPNYQAVCVNSSGGIISNNSGYNSLSYESSDGSGATVPPAPTAGATQWSVPGNTIIPAGTCRFSFDVTLPRAGTYKNVIPANIRTSGGNDADGAQASITAFAGPTVTKAYSPKSILGDGKATSTLTITLNNSSPAAVSLTAPLTDNIGNGLEITGVTTSCPGTATFSGTTITYPSGATLNPGTCTITATVRSATAGSYPNTISANHCRQQCRGGQRHLDRHEFHPPDHHQDPCQSELYCWADWHLHRHREQCQRCGGHQRSPEPQRPAAQWHEL